MSSSPADFSRIENVVSALADAGTKPKRGKNPIAPAQSAGAAIGSTTGEGRANTDPQSSNAGAGSPFTERDVGRREYHPAQEIYTEDGTLVKIHPIKKLVMTDAEGNEEIRNFALPDYASIV